jgi:purine-nucleoside phosphorylase
VFKLLGVGTIIVTNAAGGLDPEYAVGDIVVLSDHIFFAGLAGAHPLRGPNRDEFGPRFPPLSDAYDLELRQVAHAAWRKSMAGGSKRRLHEGVYAFVGGPRYAGVDLPCPGPGADPGSATRLEPSVACSTSWELI